MRGPPPPPPPPSGGLPPPARAREGAATRRDAVDGRCVSKEAWCVIVLCVGDAALALLVRLTCLRALSRSLSWLRRCACLIAACGLLRSFAPRESIVGALILVDATPQPCVVVLLCLPCWLVQHITHTFAQASRECRQCGASRSWHSAGETLSWPVFGGPVSAQRERATSLLPRPVAASFRLASGRNGSKRARTLRGRRKRIANVGWFAIASSRAFDPPLGLESGATRTQKMSSNLSSAGVTIAFATSCAFALMALAAAPALAGFGRTSHITVTTLSSAGVNSGGFTRDLGGTLFAFFTTYTNPSTLTKIDAATNTVVANLTLTSAANCVASFSNATTGFFPLYQSSTAATIAVVNLFALTQDTTSTLTLSRPGLCTCRRRLCPSASRSSSVHSRSARWTGWWRRAGMS